MHGSTMKDLQEKRGTTPRKREQLLAVLLAGGMGMSVSATGQMRATALAQATRQTTPAPSTFPVNPGVKATPDLLQTLGVGSRSIALGGAYSAIADDASATYWNPGRLPAVLNRELMLEYRPVITAFYNSTNSTLNRAGSQPGKPQIGFASLSINPGPLRIGHSVRLDNAFAVSYTVGGYLGLNFNDATVDPAKVGQSNLDLNNPNNGVPIYDPANPTVLLGRTLIRRTNSLTVRNGYITFAYGVGSPITLGKARKGGGGNLGYIGGGIGVFFVDQEYRTTTNQTTLFQDATGQLTTSNAVDRVSENGRGTGVNLGLFLRTPIDLQFGLAYRTGVSLSDLSDAAGAAFNTELPDRLTFGVAYDHVFPIGQIIVSTELQHYGSANRASVGGSGQIDARREVTNFHFGTEFTPRRFLGLDPDRFRVPLRIGFRTNEAAATNYTYNDNVISLGAAFQLLNAKKNDPISFRLKSASGAAYSIDPAIEILTRRKQVLYTITGIARF